MLVKIFFSVETPRSLPSDKSTELNCSQVKYGRHTDPNGRYDQNEIKRSKGLNYFKSKLPYILYSKISADPGLFKFRHSHRFDAVVIQFLI